MEIKVFDSELKVMEVLWKEGDLTAGQLAKILKEQIGWNRNTTYTIIKKLIDKGAIERREPNFICHALLKREQVQEMETTELINKVFAGSVDLLFASLLKRKNLPEDEIERLMEIIKKSE
ncbi:BlaI family transcriptional regulator [Clostridium thermosuccinogenes]|jgi:predicted transcriptional regulator|uniref:BlaI family transcriptional regulator n=1 Tax=Clostridium thermosuccinogenes TaxID=84032 RepID=A0A2K2FKD9_9CLOT|nr:BlaI/MecI/CopY family transcriptional regulator [Pseudoclostridium thermosuccinogenes]AUS95312.1 BlaI family transcriptional regulator [Pseudoclostridium thermosuccinogenes]PNT90626.1 BlaI family transcriptional regulator [Pseudoclostridium thermosuccinogenes]PNT97277.1 BlaI family transcriptional regulator [Pseudoclostridium thermosuccinogenes]PNT99254.1 BlaI family transcriptional regulator [Pseudoclostridium thermosuccinogenes]